MTIPHQFYLSSSQRQKLSQIATNPVSRCAFLLRPYIFTPQLAVFALIFVGVVFSVLCATSLLPPDDNSRLQRMADLETQIMEIIRLYNLAEMETTETSITFQRELERHPVGDLEHPRLLEIVNLTSEQARNINSFFDCDREGNPSKIQSLIKRERRVNTTAIITLSILLVAIIGISIFNVIFASRHDIDKRIDHLEALLIKTKSDLLFCGK